jgi:hypothetical protein
VNSDIINKESDTFWAYTKHKKKSSKALKRIRGKYEINEEFECEHGSLNFKKLSQYKKAKSALVDQ